MEPRCAAHPDRPAAGTCERCGAFSCAQDYAAVSGRWLCASCAARPDSDYLEAFRQKYWGKRDFWAWVMGLGALANLVGVGGLFIKGQYLMILVSLAIGAAEACYFLGLRWARAFIFAPAAGMVLAAALALMTSDSAGMGTVSAILGQTILWSGVTGLVGLAVFLGTRNQLFFRVPVSPGRLKKAWDLYCNNTIARSGYLLSLLGVVVPGVGALALVLSAVGLSRVDPKAFPPVGRRKQAIAGIVLGALEVIGWGAYFAAALPRRQ